MATTAEADQQNQDEQRLAELGYEQELNRAWSGFQNFAISFTIISVLAGCFTTYYQAWNNGGPIAISWGWPIISVFILIIALLHGRARVGVPDGGRHLLVVVQARRPGLGLVHRLVQPARPDRDPRVGRLLRRPVPGRDPRPLRASTSSGINFGDDRAPAARDVPAVRPDPAAARVRSTSAAATSSRCFNSVSVWWHVLGVAVIVASSSSCPTSTRASTTSSPTHLNNSGFSSRRCSGGTCCRSASC